MVARRGRACPPTAGSVLRPGPPDRSAFSGPCNDWRRGGRWIAQWVVVGVLRSVTGTRGVGVHLYEPMASGRGPVVLHRPARFGPVHGLLEGAPVDGEGYRGRRDRGGAWDGGFRLPDQLTGWAPVRLSLSRRSRRARPGALGVPPKPGMDGHLDRPVAVQPPVSVSETRRPGT